MIIFQRLRRLMLLSLIFLLSLTASLFLPPVNKIKAQECVSPTAPSIPIGTQTVIAAYEEWKNNYVTSSGANGELRVQRSANDNYDTVSEGIAYGMLFAVYNNDQTTFDKLWKYEQAHLDPNGLMNWRIDANGNTSGYNAATDADEDIALALIMADKLWSGYGAAALKQMQLILRTEVEPNSFVLKPGDEWGGSDLLNPSYLATAYYPVFQSYSGDSAWSSVQNSSYNILNKISQNTPAKTTGLLPDWSTSSGAPANNMSYQYGYDAIRGPIRLAIANAWFCDSNAQSLLAPFNANFKSIGFKNIVPGYNLDGTPAGNDGSTIPFVAAAAAAATTSTDNAYRNETWNALANAPADGYYPDSMRLFGLLVASGKFVNPLPAEPVVNPSPTSPPASSVLNIWWPSSGSAVSGTQPFKAMLEGRGIETYEMFWQVDNGKLNLMSNNNQDYPHKQANVNVGGWAWRGSGPYTITFVAKDSAGKTLASKSTSITIFR